MDPHRVQAPLRGRRRILVVGCAGAGKTTLSRELGSRLGLPVIHLDQHFWQTGWREPEPEQWEATLDELLAKPEWIMEGNYSATLPKRLAVADAILFLDFPRRVCLPRVLKRVVTGYGRTRPDLAEGCPERFDPAFLRWIWDFPERSRPAVARAIETAPDSVEVRVIRTMREIARLLDAVDSTPGGPERNRSTSASSVGRRARRQ